MNTGILSALIVSVLLAIPASAEAGTMISKTGTKDNPVIVIEYSAVELDRGIEDKHTIGRGRDFAYEVTRDLTRVVFTNDHRTRGWHLCFALYALDNAGRAIGDGVLQQGLREKGWQGYDRKVQQKPTTFPEETARIRIQMWRCSQKDFGREASEFAKRLVGIVSGAKGASKLFGVQLF